jgi:undecaprenyl phosphate N,N'-diacetylbacillosamine 1-phosphate transferase
MARPTLPLRRAAGAFIIRRSHAGQIARRDVKESVIIMGTGEAARRLGLDVERGTAPLVLCDFAADAAALAGPLGRLADVAVLIAEAPSKDEALKAVAAAWEAGAPAYVAADLLGGLASVVRTKTVAGREFVPFERIRRGPGRAVAKWLMDKLVASAFVVILAPVWLPMFAAIKLDSRGPIVFRQKRVTRGRREFNMYKFRTMFATVPKYQHSPPGADDIRVTRVGRLLRKLGLDETAQLVNVVKGQMSLVGPRPEMALTAAEYEPWQNVRLSVKPGITGLWQIAGRADRPIRESLEFDFYYLAHRSLALDAKIFLKTIPILFGKGGAH